MINIKSEVFTVHKKRNIFLILCLIIIVGIGAFKDNVTEALNAGLDRMLGSKQVSALFPFDNIDQVIEATPNVVRVKVLSSKNFKYDDIDFVSNEVQVLDTLRSNDGLKPDQKITILQTKDVNTLLQKNTEMMLFIEKYRGPIIENGYVIIGHDYGQYVVSDKNLKRVTKNLDKVKKIAVDYTSIAELKNKVDKLPYKTPEERKQEKLKEEANKEKINTPEVKQ